MLLLGRVDLYSVNADDVTHITTIVSGIALTSRFGLAVALDDANLLTVAENGDSNVGVISVFVVRVSSIFPIAMCR